MVPMGVSSRQVRSGTLCHWCERSFKSRRTTASGAFSTSLAPVPSLRGFQIAPTRKPLEHPLQSLVPMDLPPEHGHWTRRSSICPFSAPWSSNRFTSSTQRKRSSRYPDLLTIRPRPSTSSRANSRPRLPDPAIHGIVPTRMPRSSNTRSSPSRTSALHGRILRCTPVVSQLISSPSFTPCS